MIPVDHDAADRVEERAFLHELEQLVRLGLVVIDSDQMDSWAEDPAAEPRFYLTAKGRDYSTDQRLFSK